MAEPPKKKAKTNASQQTFKNSYSEEWPCITKSNVDIYHAFCTVCSTDFSVRHSGRYDCKTHVAGDKHKKYAESRGSANIASMFKSISANSTNSSSASILRAEAMVAEFIAKHNLSLSVADELVPLIKKISATGFAKDMRCGRSKATALLNGISVISQESIVKRMRIGPFTLSTDGSNDMGSSKLFPLVVRTVSETGVNSEVVSVPQCEGSATGEKIFSLIDNFFQVNSIPWANCIALGGDNANVMSGDKKGVYGFCLEKNPHIQFAGCPLHLVHIAASKGADCLPVSINDLLVDIYFFFHRSSLRTHRFNELQELYGEEPSKILKHGPTRWLSVGRCLDRVLLKWDILKDFFKAELKEELSAFARSKVEKILETLRSRSTCLYLMFLRYSIKPLEQFLTTNQSDAPKAASICQESRSLVRQIMTRFVVPTAFCGNKAVEDVQYHLPYYIKADKDILIGEECREYIRNKSKNGLTDKKIQEFYINIQQFFKTVVDYLLKVLPINNKVLNKISISNPLYLSSADASDIRFLANSFPILVKRDCSIDDIQEQFALLQSSIPENANEVNLRTDHFWILLQSEYPALVHFMLGLLTIPHSSAHCERVFSAVRKIKTDQRSLLGQRTLESLLVIKHKQESTFSVSQMSDNDIKRLKGECSAASNPSKV